jgi:hypothetical protein
MELTAEKFAQGMTTTQYIDYIKVNKEPFIQIHDNTEIPAAVLEYFDGLDQPVNLAVFTSDWCGDAMSTTPAVLRLADASDNIRLSVFSRDDELDLTNSFLPEHRAGTVPVFVVMDSNMSEIARFIETARSLVPAIDAMDDMVAQAAAAISDEAEGRQVARGRRTAYRVNKAGEWSAVILSEFQQLVADGMARPAAERPAEGGTQWPPQD